MQALYCKINVNIKNGITRFRRKICITHLFTNYRKLPPREQKLSSAFFHATFRSLKKCYQNLSFHRETSRLIYTVDLLIVFYMRREALITLFEVLQNDVNIIMELQPSELKLCFVSIVNLFHAIGLFL